MAAHYSFIIYSTAVSHSTVLGCNTILFALFIACIATKFKKIFCAPSESLILWLLIKIQIVFRLAENNGFYSISPLTTFIFTFVNCKEKHFSFFIEFLKRPLYIINPTRHELNYQNATAGINGFTNCIWGEKAICLYY